MPEMGVTERNARDIATYLHSAIAVSRLPLYANALTLRRRPMARALRPLARPPSGTALEVLVDGNVMPTGRQASTKSSGLTSGRQRQRKDQPTIGAGCGLAGS